MNIVAPSIPSANNVWENGGAGVTINWVLAETALGQMLLAATQKGICRLSFDEDENDLRRRFPNADLAANGDAIARWVKDAMMAMERPTYAHDIPIDVQGTAFQEAVWQALRQIPSGETRTYADIAAAVGKPDAVRAAGAANGANHVAVLIPCHRVVRSDGALGGYAYGLHRKQTLLAWERGQGNLFSA